MTPTILEPLSIYRIKLCSGEQRRWQFLRMDGLSRSVWRDVDTGLEFNEASLLYVWEVVGKDMEGPRD